MLLVCFEDMHKNNSHYNYDVILLLNDNAISDIAGILYGVLTHVLISDHGDRIETCNYLSIHI